MIASHLSKIFRLNFRHKGFNLFALLLVAGLGGMVGQPWLAKAESWSNRGESPALYQADQSDGSDNGRDANCLMCHADPDFKGSFQNGETISLYVDNGQY